MPRSDEHNFVTATFINIAPDLSRSELYGYTGRPTAAYHHLASGASPTTVSWIRRRCGHLGSCSATSCLPRVTRASTAGSATPEQPSVTARDLARNGAGASRTSEAEDVQPFAHVTGATSGPGRPILMVLDRLLIRPTQLAPAGA
jgi:hypothetical protein